MKKLYNLMALAMGFVLFSSVNVFADKVLTANHKVYECIARLAIPYPDRCEKISSIVAAYSVLEQKINEDYRNTQNRIQGIKDTMDMFAGRGASEIFLAPLANERMAKDHANNKFLALSQVISAAFPLEELNPDDPFHVDLFSIFYNLDQPNTILKLTQLKNQIQ